MRPMTHNSFHDKDSFFFGVYLFSMVFSLGDCKVEGGYEGTRR